MKYEFFSNIVGGMDWIFESGLMSMELSFVILSFQLNPFDTPLQQSLMPKPVNQGLYNYGSIDINHLMISNSHQLCD